PNGRRPMRHLYTRHPALRPRAAAPQAWPRPERGGSARGVGGQPLPLHRLSEDRRRRAGRRAPGPPRGHAPVRAALSPLPVARTRELAHALELIGGHPGSERLTPLAGGTDLLVYLNAGLGVGRGFLDLWGLNELRGIRADRDGITLGALTTFSEIREREDL